MTGCATSEGHVFDTHKLGVVTLRYNTHPASGNWRPDDEIKASLGHRASFLTK